MRFRTIVSNSNLLLRVVQSIDKLAKGAILKLTPEKLHIIVLTDIDSGLQLWSDVAVDALFQDYRIESIHNNEIYLEFSIDNLMRALKSAQGALRTTLKLTKKQVHIMMPPLNSVRSIAERMKTMGDRVAISANREGEMTIRVTNELGLENLSYDASQEPSASTTPGRAPGDHFTAVVDMKNFLRFLQSYHVAPKNIVCCIIEQHAVVFYVYIGTTGYGVGALNDQNCGSLTYFVPVRQV
ncbi:cell cycle checkpoint [Linderina pennispora]|uniref:Checkpoint protein n=1 Tax=Linderina pennispora TaxID=61395 RepID=A0A1Y1WE82_9FUNG|nr:cell cycle checkpoint [Linderina pennispora]ORX71546.1 cell cycle checkpoint [Linderina pennispora]